MNKIPNKNYIILIILLVVTIFIVAIIANIYSSSNKAISDFYEYSNKITKDEFDEYMIENTDSIIYIADKHDLKNEKFEHKFKNKLDSLNLHNRLVYIDKNDIDKEFINKLKKNYKIDIDTKKMPVVITIIDKINIKIFYIDENTNVSDFIDYGEFK